MITSLVSLIIFHEADGNNFAFTTTGMLENEKQQFKYNLAFF